MELIRRLGSALRVATLDSLLLGINSRTGKPDHMINIGKLVTLNQHLPQHALAALHIVRRVATSPSTQHPLLALYTKSPALTTGKFCSFLVLLFKNFGTGFIFLHRYLIHAIAIRYGFVEALEMEDMGDLSSSSNGDQDGDAGNAGQGCRLVVLHLLCEGVNLPHPSLAHFLLGFNTQSPLSKYVLLQALA